MLHPTRNARITVAVLAVATMLLAGGAAALHAMRPPEPVIAIVNLNGVLNSLNQYTQRLEELKRVEESRAAEIKALEAKVTEENEKLEHLPEDQKRDQLLKIQQLLWELDAKRQVNQLLLRRDQATLLKQMDNAIRDAVASIAELNGYTMVFNDDDARRVPNDSPEAVSDAVLSKKFLYVSRAHDITKEVSDYMNNQYAAAGQ